VEQTGFGIFKVSVLKDTVPEIFFFKIYSAKIYLVEQIVFWKKKLCS